MQFLYFFDKALSLTLSTNILESLHRDVSCGFCFSRSFVVLSCSIIA